MNYNFMKGGMQFVDNAHPISGKLSLCGDGKNLLQYKQKEVKTHLKIKDEKHLQFTLYNIESFNEYAKDDFDLSEFDMKDIEHLFLCGFLTKITRKELFIKKGKEGDNEKSLKEIGKTLYKLSEELKNDPNKITYKIQIILAHSTDKKALCIIFNMSDIDSEYYDLLKKYLPDTLFSDEKELMRKVTKSQLENLIEFTNEKLSIEPKIEPKADITLGLKWEDAGNEEPLIGDQYNNDNLEKALKGKKFNFSEQELKDFGVDITDKYQYIKVGEDYYTQVLDTNDYEYIEKLLKQEILYKKLEEQLEKRIIDKVFADSKIKNETSYTNSVGNITNLDNILKIIDFFKKLIEKLEEEDKGPTLNDKKAYVNNNLRKLQSLKNNIEAEIPKSKTKFLLSLLFPNAKVDATVDERDVIGEKSKEPAHPAPTEEVLEVEKKLKAELSYEALQSKFSEENIEIALKAAGIDAAAYKKLTDKLGKDGHSSGGGGEKYNLLRGGTLTPEDNAIFQTILKSLQETDTEKENTEILNSKKEVLSRYDKLVSTVSPGAAPAADEAAANEAAAPEAQAPDAAPDAAPADTVSTDAAPADTVSTDAAPAGKAAAQAQAQAQAPDGTLAVAPAADDAVNKAADTGKPPADTGSPAAQGLPPQPVPALKAPEAKAPDAAQAQSAQAQQHIIAKGLGPYYLQKGPAAAEGTGTAAAKIEIPKSKTRFLLKLLFSSGASIRAKSVARVLLDQAQDRLKAKAKQVENESNKETNFGAEGVAGLTPGPTQESNALDAQSTTVLSVNASAPEGTAPEAAEAARADGTQVGPDAAPAPAPEAAEAARADGTQVGPEAAGADGTQVGPAAAPAAAPVAASAPDTPSTAPVAAPASEISAYEAPVPEISAAAKAAAAKAAAKAAAEKFRDINPIIYNMAIMEKIFNDNKFNLKDERKTAAPAAAEAANASAKAANASAKAANASAKAANASAKAANASAEAAINRNKAPAAGKDGMDKKNIVTQAAQAATQAATEATQAAQEATQATQAAQEATQAAKSTSAEIFQTAIKVTQAEKLAKEKAKLAEEKAKLAEEQANLASNKTNEIIGNNKK